MSTQTKWILLAVLAYVVFVRGRAVPAATGQAIATDGPWVYA